jgi:hypothetical protein
VKGLFCTLVLVIFGAACSQGGDGGNAPAVQVPNGGEAAIPQEESCAPLDESTDFVLAQDYSNVDLLMEGAQLTTSDLPIDYLRSSSGDLLNFGWNPRRKLAANRAEPLPALNEYRGFGVVGMWINKVETNELDRFFHGIESVGEQFSVARFSQIHLDIETIFFSSSACAQAYWEENTLWGEELLEASGPIEKLIYSTPSIEGDWAPPDQWVAALVDQTVIIQVFLRNSGYTRDILTSEDPAARYPAYPKIDAVTLTRTLASRLSTQMASNK